MNVIDAQFHKHYGKFLTGNFLLKINKINLVNTSVIFRLRKLRFFRQQFHD